MSFSFCAYGHKNITAKHKTTLEFAKDKELTKKGDCIVGVNADFDYTGLKAFVEKQENNKAKLIITADNIIESLTCELNRNFDDKNEVVIRKTDFISKRTLGINANKASSDLNRVLINKLKDPKTKIHVKLIRNS